MKRKKKRIPDLHDPDRTGALHDVGCAGRGPKIDFVHTADTAYCGGTFRCSKCKRTVGWCYGVDGSNRCNDCAPLPKDG